jgi:hypothetical protein
MRYDDLHTLLRALESRVSDVRPQQSGLDALVRNIPQRTPVQAFGLSRHTENKNPDRVVVAVGINYTQGPMRCPRDGLHRNAPDKAAVVDGLGGHRSLVTRAFDAYRNSPGEWARNGCASSAAVDVPSGDNFHLVMTNFCLWITNDAWADLARTSESSKVQLLTNNPLFDGETTGAPGWPHLTRLAEELRQEDTVWVPHGITGDVPQLFFDFVATRPGMGWIVAPNLSRPYNYSGKSFPCPLPRV